MRIEILVGSDEPLIFSLKSSRMTIGSSENCDIVISADGVSRKHLIIQTESDKYYIVDQGSTNGTFVNEERLVPGRKVEFTSFFPLRLGDNVLVSLLSDEEDSASILSDFREKSSPKIQVNRPQNSDTTKVISLKELKKVKTEELVLVRDKKRTAKKARQVTAKPKPKETNYLKILAVLLVGGAAYYTFFLKEKVIPEQIGVVGKVVPLDKSLEPKKVSFLIADADLVPRESYSSISNDIKCSSDLEKLLCETLGLGGEGSGVVQTGLTLNILVNFEPALSATDVYFNEVQLKDSSLEDVRSQAAILVYLMRQVPDLDETKFADFRLSFAFYILGENNVTLSKVVAIYPKELNRLHKEIDLSVLNFLKQNPEGILDFTKEYYRTY